MEPNFNEHGLQEELSDVRVDAEGVDQTIVTSYKRKVRDFGVRVANYFRPYRNKVLGHINQTYHKIRNLGRRGAQYLAGANLQEVDSSTFYKDPEFADEGIGHELVHSAHDATGGLRESFDRGIEGTIKYGIGFLYAVKNLTEGLTTYIWQDITGKRSKSLYAGLGLDRAAGHILRKYGDEAIRPRNQRKFENMVNEYVQTAGAIYAI